ncbi:MAG: hypothetical protein H0U13_14265, partial [Gemmatimonadaceae bacterium]|nr:hypothetical protein [Gemmatimonadaceae bacterium]
MQPGDSIAAGSLARAIALALADPAVRAQVLEDMRDSPFPEHAIHITSYLAGERGRALATVAAQRAGVSVSDLTGKGAVRGGLQLVMRRPIDRTTWTGTGDIVVMGVASTVKERLRSKPVSIAYDIRGLAVEIPILSSVPFPFFVIEPGAKPFGPDPETTRRSAPTRARGTISTREEEWVAMYAGPGMTTTSEPGEPSCDPVTAIIECSVESGGGGPIGLVTPSGYSLATCYPAGGVGDASLDADTDGVVDQCEFELTTVFAPRLQFDVSDCNTGREPY